MIPSYVDLNSSHPSPNSEDWLMIPISSSLNRKGQDIFINQSHFGTLTDLLETYPGQDGMFEIYRIKLAQGISIKSSAQFIETKCKHHSLFYTWPNGSPYYSKKYRFDFQISKEDQTLASIEARSQFITSKKGDCKNAIHPKGGILFFDPESWDSF